MNKDVLEFEVNDHNINLLRRLEAVLDVISMPGFVLLPDDDSGYEPNCSHKLQSGKAIDYELWVTLGQLTGCFGELKCQFARGLSKVERAELFVRFPDSTSLVDCNFGDAFNFLRAATWIPHRHDNIDDREFTELIRQSPFDEVYRSGRIVAALQRKKDLCKPSELDILCVLRFKQIFDRLTLDQLRTWNGWESLEIEAGVPALHMPYTTYHDAIAQWISAVYSTRFYQNPYRYVPGLEHGVPPPRFLKIGDRGKPTPEQFFQDANLDEVRQYMAVCLRGEKWSTGHIANEFKRGVIQAAFKRLEELFSQFQSSSGD